MDIEWDKVKASANKLKHGVSFADAVIALKDPMSMVSEDDSHEEQRFQSIGMDGKGRILIVVFTYRGNRHRLISARKAVKWERKLYEG
ncbi:MAG: BrnT family toxin [Magnetococcales bacterium]|nr:BrnT family toxin [Magnetococcales bacterium]